MEQQTNQHIQCVVNECKHHSQGKNYCTLDKISVGKIGSYTNRAEDTDCESYASKDSFK